MSEHRGKLSCMRETFYGENRVNSQIEYISLGSGGLSFRSQLMSMSEQWEEAFLSEILLMEFHVPPPPPQIFR